MQTRDVLGQKMPQNANIICERSLITVLRTHLPKAKKMVGNTNPSANSTVQIVLATNYQSQISKFMIHETELNGCFCNPLSHMHGLCIRFSALQISRQWMNDLYVEKIYSHFRFSKPRHYQSKSKRFLPSTGNIFASTFDGGFFNISWQIQVGMNGILLPKLFWLCYCEKKCSSDWEKLLKFEDEVQEFSKILRLHRTIYSISGRSEQFLVTESFFNLFL